MVPLDIGICASVAAVPEIVSSFDLSEADIKPATPVVATACKVPDV